MFIIFKNVNICNKRKHNLSFSSVLEKCLKMVIYVVHWKFSEKGLLLDHTDTKMCISIFIMPLLFGGGVCLDLPLFICMYVHVIICS